MTEDDDAALKARLARLSDTLAAADKRSAADERGDGRARDGALGGALGLGMRVMGEFVAAVGVSALIGWQLDQWFSTTPWLLLAFLALGTVAGFWSVYKTAMGDKTTGYRRMAQRPAPGTGDTPADAGEREKTGGGQTPRGVGRDGE